jgi:hypothetical protein
MNDFEINYIYSRGNSWYITPSAAVANWRGEIYYAIGSRVRE